MRVHDYRGSPPKLQLLNQVQRLGGRQVLRAFKAVALPVLEVEATALPTSTRLKRRTVTQLASLCDLPDNDPVKRCAVGLLTRPDCYQSPAGATRRLLQKQIDPKKEKHLAVELAWILAPWIDPQIDIYIPESTAAKELLQRMRKQQCLMLYTDGSAHQKLSGSALYTNATTRCIRDSQTQSEGPLHARCSTRS